ncbi:MAG TPA: twin-arginine translocase TatA/TatE family subunit [Actinomycetota bacterium]|nr:twin-arginine translocase TatA/TatE family subunit [Actinomycetota bacterium]
MPSLGFGEILIILVLALIIFGPRRLPEMGRTIGRSLRDFRRATSDIRTELESELDEPPPVTVEERARRIEERKARSTPPPEDTPPSD